MKVVFLIEIPDTRALGFAHKPLFDAAGIAYEYWDIRSLSGDKRAVGKVANPYPDVVIREFSSKDDVLEALPEYQECVFIAGHIILNWNRFIYKAFKQYQIRYIVLCNKLNFTAPTELFVRMFTVRKGLINGIYNFTYFKLKTFLNKYSGSIQKPVYAIIGNRYDKYRYNFPNPQKGFVLTHALDYERLFPYLNQVSDKNTIVFLDQNLPFHNEAKEFNRWKMNAESYYTKIASFLNTLSKITGKAVHIATHPKAERGKIEGLVGSIPVHYGQTNELVTSCSFAVAHCSMSMSLSVLQNKPFMLITCSEIEPSPVSHYTYQLGKMFNKPVLNINQINLHSMEELSAYLSIDETSYKRYIEGNIKAPNTPDKSYWEIIVDYIIKMNKS